MSQNPLVTGGAGFINSNFIRCSQIHYPKVRITNLDLLTYTGSIANNYKGNSYGEYQFKLLEVEKE